MEGRGWGAQMVIKVFGLGRVGTFPWKWERLYLKNEKKFRATTARPSEQFSGVAGRQVGSARCGRYLNPLQAAVKQSSASHQGRSLITRGGPRCTAARNGESVGGGVSLKRA